MCVATAAFLSQPQKKKNAKREEILQQHRDFVRISRKAACTLHRLPTPPNLPGKGCLEVLREMPSFSPIQQFFIVCNNKQTNTLSDSQVQFSWQFIRGKHLEAVL